MKYWTGTEIKEKVRRDLGLQQEEFVDPIEFLGYINSAIDEAEAEIHTIYEDYFVPEPAVQNIVAGQKEYALPADIYANKIRSMVYKVGSDIIPVRKFKPKANFFEQALQQDQHHAQDYYRYIIYNNSGTGKPVLHLHPTPNKSVEEALYIWYIRNANRLEVYSDSVDIPEFTNFIIQYCKVRCYEKEGHPNLPTATSKLEFYRDQMVATLTDMVPDGDTAIQMDTDFYDYTV